MTRKRFVKLLMSLGFSRNRAVETAKRMPAGWQYGYYLPVAYIYGIAGLNAERTAKVVCAIPAVRVISAGSLVVCAAAERRRTENAESRKK